MKVLVTGCCGFIGSHFCERLLKMGHKILGIDDMNNYYDVSVKEKNLEILNKYPEFTFFKEDIRDTNRIEIWKPDTVCHLASMAGVRNSIKNPSLYFDVNVNGFVNLLEQCKNCNVKKIVYASSSSVYGLNKKIPFSEEDEIKTCNSPYACSKITMELIAKTYFQLYNLSSIGLRFFTVYGPRGRPDMAPHKFLKSIYNDEEIPKYGSGESSRDYTYIGDIVNGISSALFREKQDYQIYNLGNNCRVKLNEFIETCENVVGKKAKIKELENQLGDVPMTLADITKAKKDLNYEPKTTLYEGLFRTFDSIKNS